ncbi:MAG: chorismate-binding protein, partial [Firmicutes bacterium]|nr:chorismate-binding protein [Bacillota bacterium]
MAVLEVVPPLDPAAVLGRLEAAAEGFWVDLPGGGFVAGCCPERTLTAVPDQQPLAGWEPPAPGPEPAPAWAGVLTYELGSLLDPRPSRPCRRQPFPLWHLGYYPAVLYADTDGRQFLADARGVAAARAGLEAWRREARVPDPAPPLVVTAASWDRRGFLEGVRTVQAAIRRGDVYLVNLARILHLAGPPADATRFLALRSRLHPARGAFYRTRTWAVLSASPELFLERTPAGVVRTAPIKGTRPRGRNPEADRALAGELLASEKDRAELIMVVDLERNDL